MFQTTNQKVDFPKFLVYHGWSPQILTQASTRVEFRTPSAASSVDPSNGNEQKLYQYEGFHKWGYPKMHGL